MPGRPTLVAIDGLTCAGKSTLAGQVAGALEDAEVVGLDDFYRPLAAEERAVTGPKESYDRYFDWKRLLRDVLVPLSRQSRARYRRYDWDTNALAEWHEIESRSVVIVEGVYSTRPELRRYFNVMVYVDAPRKVRLARLLDRRYPDTSWIDHWMAGEDWYVEHVRPAEQVTLVVDGSGAVSGERLACDQPSNL